MDINLRYFPNLKKDKSYQITSPKTSDYNCISWARGVDDCWSWPPLECDMADDQYWPTCIPNNTKIETFVRLFELEGFTVCQDDANNHDVICLYHKDGNCTHAARKLTNGLWTSKLGPLNDIQHSSPHSLEGEMYGRIYCYMKRSK